MVMTKRPKEDKFLLAIMAFLLTFILMYRTCAKAATIEEMIRVEAVKQGIDPDIAVAVAKVESNLNPKALGSFGEIGLFQIMPYYAKGRNLWSLKTNIQVGIHILKACTKNTPSTPYAIVCYNQGLHRHPRYPELHPYYKRVVAALP